MREIKTYEGRNDNFIGRSPLEESQTLSRNIARVRSQVVITALQALVMHLSGLREGRKTLLFVSRGIPLLFDISLEPDFQAILREANRGNVIIHTLDPRGLGQGTFVHSTLYRLASETGGHAIVNTNDLSKGLERVVRDASHYYLIGYAPTRDLNDGKFHKIAVKVKRKGARTVARRGYWAPTADEMNPVAAAPLEPGRVERAHQRCSHGARTGWRTWRPASRPGADGSRAPVGHVAARAGLQRSARASEGRRPRRATATAGTRPKARSRPDGTGVVHGRRAGRRRCSCAFTAANGGRRRSSTAGR